MECELLFVPSQDEPVSDIVFSRTVLRRILFRLTLIILASLVKVRCFESCLFVQVLIRFQGSTFAMVPKLRVFS